MTTPSPDVPPSMWTTEKTLAQPCGCLSSTSALKLNTELDDFQIRHMTNRAIWTSGLFHCQRLLVLPLVFLFLQKKSERTRMRGDRASGFCFLSHLEGKKVHVLLYDDCKDYSSHRLRHSSAHWTVTACIWAFIRDHVPRPREEIHCSR